MTQATSQLRRVLGSSGIYAIGSVAQSGLSFLLLPIYTRFLGPSEFGLLELLTAFSGVLFLVLVMGLPSAIVKCYHRDCKTPEDRASLLATAAVVAFPVLVAGAFLVSILADGFGSWLSGEEHRGTLVRLIVATGVCTSLLALVLSSLRAAERATAYVLLSLGQVALALTLNIVFVVAFGLGVRGVLLGNLISNGVVLAMAALVLRGNSVRVNRRLVAPLLRFGWLLVPVMLSRWVMDLADRYVLRMYWDLEHVAVYSLGYKIAMVLHILVVWPFQLAWPAFSFSISEQEGHRTTYGRAMTYLTLVLTVGVLGLSLLAPAVLPAVTGPGFEGAARVVPPVTLAYAFHGVYYCVLTGVHLSEKTQRLPMLSAAFAGVNLALNFLLIPSFGTLGAVWATLIASLGLAASAFALSQKYYPVNYEVWRLIKVVAVGAAVYFAALALGPAHLVPSVAWGICAAVIVFPLALLATGFLNLGERAAIRRVARRYLPFGAS